jgi:hypothetical protein
VDASLHGQRWYLGCVGRHGALCIVVRHAQYNRVAAELDGTRIGGWPVRVIRGARR